MMMMIIIMPPVAFPLPQFLLLLNKYIEMNSTVFGLKALRAVQAVHGCHCSHSNAPHARSLRHSRVVGLEVNRRPRVSALTF